MSASDKTQLRQRMRALRSALTAEDRRTNSRWISDRVLALDDIRRAAAVFAYVSYRDEVETHALLEKLLSLGKTIVVPKVLCESGSHRPRMIAVPLRDFTELRPGQLGILEPTDATPFEDPIDLCIAPGIAFTERGERLGSGFGHYDQFLAAHPVKTIIGLAFECQIVPHIEHEPHDRRMDFIVTEQRVIQCHSRPSAAC